VSKIVAIDTETTSLRPDRRAWEIGLVVPDGDKRHHYRWLVDVADLDLGNADPFSLKIGGFHDRHPQMLLPHVSRRVTSEAVAMRRVEELTRGAHLLGAVPSFDADVLDRRMRAYGILPSWHYHLIDVEALAIGYLHGRAVVGEHASGLPVEILTRLPWDSEELSRACGVEPPAEHERHTALGDAYWAFRLYQTVTGAAGG
jgi:DNA polymerase III epsilon subunit-like protein